ncbi:MAG: peptide deformylase [Gemmatimonadota bacterium]|nr:peptide deformylase [Gemmatimonadota bacterium]MDH3422324.1 peptide deformylase [Gemmatimonadota bacterium]
MSVREIVMMGDPVLREVAEEVDAFDDALRALVRDMFETMYHADGIGLAAPQIGISSRILVIDLRRDDDHDDDDEPIALVNPRVAWQSTAVEKQTEGCLSIPGLEEVVERPGEVRVEAQDPDGNPVSIAADKLLARALQHEIDHLDGVLFLDRVSPLKRRMLLKKWKKLESEEA